MTAVGLDALPPALVGDVAVARVLATGLTSLADWFASDFASVRAGQGALEVSGLDPATPARTRWLAERHIWLEGHLPSTFSIYEPMADPRVRFRSWWGVS